MSARMRFALAVIVLGLLMTGPFVLTAILVWVEAKGAQRELLIQVIEPLLPLGALLTIMGFAVGVSVLRNLFRQYVQGLLRMAENLRLMLGANAGFRAQFFRCGSDDGQTRRPRPLDEGLYPDPRKLGRLSKRQRTVVKQLQRQADPHTALQQRIVKWHCDEDRVAVLSDD